MMNFGNNENNEDKIIEDLVNSLVQPLDFMRYVKDNSEVRYGRNDNK